MLQLSNVSKRYGDATVLENVSFIVNPGDRAGLIGPNGCGKTTILRLVAGHEAPDAGSVQLNPPGLRPGYLEQGQRYGEQENLADFLHEGEASLEAASAKVARLAAGLTTAASRERRRAAREYDEALAALEALSRTLTPRHELEAALAGLGLGSLPLDTPVATLSGGQKTRLGLARVLARGPRLLLLDEPTNHLDVEALEWLEGWLRAYDGAALVVSHDRTFLDESVTRILDLDPHSHTVVEYTGNYSDYIEAWEKKRAKQWAEYHDQVAETKRLEHDARLTKQRALRAEATSTLDTERRLAKKAGKKAKVKDRRLERYLESPDRIEKPTRTWQIKLGFDEVAETGKDVLVLEDAAIGYGGVPLVSGIRQVLRAGERVVLTGPNGAGKTTLLRVVAGHLAPIEGRVRLGTNVQLGYYAQEQETLDPASTPFDTIIRAASMTETDARSFLHYFLFAGDEVFTPVARLSHGERARLVLACLVATGCNFLLLDEPINHLDIPSRTMFEEAMQAFQGTVLAVVHDRYFIRRFATRVWYVRDGALRSYVDLEDLKRGRRMTR